MNNQLCIVLDFGGQYNQLIARRVRECGVYCEIKRYDTPISELAALHPAGIIFTGGPNSVYDEASPISQRRSFRSASRSSASATAVSSPRIPSAARCRHA